MRYILILLLIYLIGPLLMLVSGRVSLTGNWQTADRSSAGIAPDPAIVSDAVIQVYAARAFNWRGLFSVHTWIAIKAEHAKHYEVFQVVGWRILHGLSPVVMEADVPDRNWFSHRPVIIADIRGQKAQKLIPKLIAAARKYPYSKEYVLWPGPNSNTFTAYIARQVPELALALPANAVGKDYLGKSTFFAKAPSGTGWQFSILGLVGILIAKKEGLELNLLGLVVAINPLNLSLSLPGVG
jgi:Protein of unknown function (DUF3750)